MKTYVIDFMDKESTILEDAEEQAEDLKTCMMQLMYRAFPEGTTQICVAEKNTDAD